MADQPGTIEVIARELAGALEPLKDKMTPEAAPSFLGELGLNLPSGFADAATAISGTAVKAGALGPLVVDLVDAIDDEDASAIVAAAVPLLGAIVDVIDAIAALEPAMDAAVAAAAGLTPAQRTFLESQATALPGRLLEWMLVEYIENKSADVYTALTLLGLIDDAIEPGIAGDETRPPLRRRGLFLDRIVTMLTAPDDYLTAAFEFGEPSFDAMEFFVPLATYLDSLDLAVDVITPPTGPPVLESYVVRLSTDPGTNPPALTTGHHVHAPPRQPVVRHLHRGRAIRRRDRRRHPISIRAHDHPAVRGDRPRHRPRSAGSEAGRADDPARRGRRFTPRVPAVHSGPRRVGVGRCRPARRHRAPGASRGERGASRHRLLPR